ncbi:MAG: hypothetical protein HZA50_04445 [Planctomycetes bacterium]|nr:hypothetical protein [Planctomycetota bacterium]
MIILHNRHDEDSRRFVAEAVAQYGDANVTVIDWHGLSDEEKTKYVRAGLSPSAFPSIIADAAEKWIPRMERDEAGNEVGVLDGDGKPVMDTIPASLKIIRKPATVAQAAADCAALGRLATPEKIQERMAGFSTHLHGEKVG